MADRDSRERDPEARDRDREHERDRGDRDRGERGERDRSKSKAPSNSNSKSKDLSHVPCKFYRVGACTAGSSCPFSHSSREPGGSKDVCQWFVKGNCKFGHKCALAHVLPGQSMAMDRKNKKAAQIAAGGGGGDRASGGGSGSGNSNGAGNGGRSRRNGGGVRNSLLGGSTAPTRGPGRPPGLASAISPPVVAPPVHTTTAFDTHGVGGVTETDNLPNAHAALSEINSAPRADTPSLAVEGPDGKADSATGVVPVAVPRRPSVTNRPSEFGPIGSPTKNSPIKGGAGGFSPATSPSRFESLGPTGPLPAPAHDFRSRAGLASSLGATRLWSSDYGLRPTVEDDLGQMGSSALGGELVPPEDDIDDVVLGSMDDMATLEERIRGLGGAKHQMPISARANSTTMAEQQQHHKYSRSMPSNTLLGDVKALWGNENGASPGPGSLLSGGGLGNGTPSSFTSAGFGGRAGAMDDTGTSLGVSPGAALLSPSNASAAFLPGMHSVYRPALHQHPPAAQRSISATHAPQRAGLGLPGSLGGTALLSQSRLAAGAGVGPLSPPRSAGFARPAFESLASEPHLSHMKMQAQTSSSSQFPLRTPPHTSMEATFAGAYGQPPLPHQQHPSHQQPRQPHLGHSALSPSTIALQAHAPGQSLPQGLAAGYSRIHAQPPNLNGSNGMGSPGAGVASPAGLGYTEWLAGGVGAGPMHQGSTRPAPVPTGRVPSGGAGHVNQQVPRGWGGAPHTHATPLSPLAQPEAGADNDDDLFVLDH